MPEFYFPHVAELYPIEHHDDMTFIEENDHSREILTKLSERILTMDGHGLRELEIDLIEAFPGHRKEAYTDVLRYLKGKGYTVEPIFRTVVIERQILAGASIRIGWRAPAL